MIIDAHCHAFLPEDLEVLVQKLTILDHQLPDDNPHKWRLDMAGALEDVLAAQAACGVDEFVLLPVTSRPERVAAMNRWAAQAAREHGAIIPFGTLLPGCDVSAELALMATLGLRGVKLHPFLQRFRLDDPLVLRMFDQIEDSGLPVLIDTLQDDGLLAAKPHMAGLVEAFNLHGCQAHELCAVAAAHPRTKFIAAHGGSCYGWDQIDQLNRLDNVYYDLSWIGYLIPPEQVVAIIRGKGAERVVYGSDAPFRSPGPYLEWFMDLPLTAGEREMILGGTMRDLLAGGA